VTIAVAAKKNFLETVTAMQGVCLCRDLVNDNADFITSAYLEKTVRHLIKGKKNIRLEVLNSKELKAKGLFLHLSVNQGSTKEPKLIIVRYQGSKEKRWLHSTYR